MGAGASTHNQGAHGVVPHPPMNTHRTEMSFFGAPMNSPRFLMSMRSSLVSGTSSKTESNKIGTSPYSLRQQSMKNKVVRVPLNVAVHAAVLIQKIIRGFIVRKKMYSTFRPSYLTNLNTTMGSTFGQIHRTGSTSSKRSFLQRSMEGHNDFLSSQHSMRNNPFSISRAGMGSTAASSAMVSSHKMSASLRVPSLRVNTNAGYLSNVVGSQTLHTAAPSPIPGLEIVPLVGFVIKTKLIRSQRKVFVNVCHYPHIESALALPLREWIDSTHRDEEGEVKLSEVLVTDILVPSKYFFDHMHFQSESQSLVPNREASKEMLALNCVEYWNSLYASGFGDGGESTRVMEEDEDEDSLGDFHSIALALDDTPGQFKRRDHSKASVHRNISSASSVSSSKKSTSSANSHPVNSRQMHGGGHSMHDSHGLQSHKKFAPPSSHNNHGGHFDFMDRVPHPKYLAAVGRPGESESSHGVDLEYILESEFSLPKIRRCYMGRLHSILYDSQVHSADYVQPMSLRDASHTALATMTAGSVDCEGVVPPAEVQCFFSLPWHTIHKSPPIVHAEKNTSATTHLTSGALVRADSQLTNNEKEKDARSGTGPEEDDSDDSLLHAFSPKKENSKGKDSRRDRKASHKERELNVDSARDKGKDKEDELLNKKIIKDGFIVYAEAYLGILHIYEKRTGVTSPSRLREKEREKELKNEKKQEEKEEKEKAKEKEKENEKEKTKGSATTATTPRAKKIPPQSLSPSLSFPAFPLNRSIPGGEREIARLLLAHIELSSEYDASSDLHLLHLELVSDEIDSPFNVEKFFHRFSVSSDLSASLAASIATHNVENSVKQNSTKHSSKDSDRRRTRELSLHFSAPMRSSSARTINSLPTAIAEKHKDRTNVSLFKDPNKITMQFASLSELLSWKLMLQAQIDFSFELWTKAQTPFNGVMVQSSLTMKFHNLLLNALPATKSFFMQERSLPLATNLNNKAHPRKRVFAKLDRGYLGLFLDDNTVTPTWSTAIEIIPLKYCRLEVKHKKIVRLQRTLARIVLVTRDARREFFLHSAPEKDQKDKDKEKDKEKEKDAADAETLSIISAWEDQIDYSNSMHFRYLAPYFKDVDLLKNPNNTAPPTTLQRGMSSRNSMSSDAAHVTCMSSGVMFKICCPEPSTSDDDSDIEDSEKLDEDSEISVFRLARPRDPSASLPNTQGAGTNCGNSSNNNGSSTSLARGANSTVKPGSLALNSSTSSLSSMQSSRITSLPTAPTSVAPSAARGTAAVNQTPRGRSASVLVASSTLGSASEEKNEEEPVAPLPVHTMNSIAFYEKCMNWKNVCLDRFSQFPTSETRFLHGHVLYIQEPALLVLMYEFHVVTVMHITKCVEITPMRRGARGGNSGLSGSPMRSKRHTSLRSLAEKNSKLYDLDSSDDSDADSSDRDYDQFDEEDELNAMATGAAPQFTTTNDASHTFMLTAMSYDGRTYKLKFYNKHDYYDWRQLFYDHDPNHLKSASALRNNQAGVLGSIGRISGLPSLVAVQNAASNLAGRTSAALQTLKESSISLPSVTSGVSGGRVFYDSQNDDKSPVDPLIVFDNENTKKYNKQLRNGERVIACGQVMKHERVMPHSNATNAPKQRRILLVTDLPRLMFIDTIGGIVRGSVDLIAESKMDFKTYDNNDFEVNIGSNINRFTAVELPDKDGKFWITKVRQAVLKLS